MPNHWHLVLRPSADGELSLFMRWLTQTHTQRWRHAKRTVGYGALYQGRFKSFIVQEEDYFLVLCRYVEQNALRARLVDRAEQWRWSSAWMRSRGDATLRELLSDWPVDRPRNWLALLNGPQDNRQTSAVRTSIERSRPLGEAKWVDLLVKRLGLVHTIRDPGRPKKERNS
jgi:putative transposase